MAGVLALAALARLTQLGFAPFTPGEATQAVAALPGVAGVAGAATGVSPLLLALHRLTFGLAQATDTSARLWPALAGVLAVALAMGVRRELGRLEALAAAALMALSSTLVFWSRNAAGESLAVLGGVGLVVALAAWRRNAGVWPARGVAAALALLVMSAPVAYSILLAAAPLIALALWSRSERHNAAASHALRQGALVFALLVALASTGFFFAPSGLASVAELPAAWLRGFGRAPAGPDGMAAASSLWGLGLTLVWLEPLVLALGLAGLVMGQRRRSWLVQGLSLWALLALGLAVVRPGRSAADLIPLVVPLALLGGLALAAVLRIGLAERRRAEVWMLLAAGLAALASATVWLADFASEWKAAPATPFLWSAGVAVLVLLALFAVYWLSFGPRLTGRVAALLAAAMLLLLGLRGMAMTSRNHDGLRWGSLDAVTGASGSVDVEAALAHLAMQRGTDVRDLPVAFLTAPGNDPPALLRWMARNTAQARGRPLPPTDDSQRVWLGLASDLPPAGALSGQSFRIAQRWSPDGLRGSALLNWLLFGHFDTLTAEQRAVLWVSNQ